MDDQAVLRALASLEALADTDWHSAGCQMFALYPKASARFLHDVCDAIDLWICEIKLTPRLVDHLRDLITKESDASLKLHYEGWLKSAQ